jgi:hypothetical protein
VALVSRAVALGALVLLASATPALAAQWLRVTDTDSTTSGVDVARSGNGALNVLWGHDKSILNSQVSANGNTASGPHTVFVYENVATGSPALLPAPGGTLRAFFTGIDASNPQHDCCVSTATSTDGIGWAVQPTAASDSTPEGSTAKGNLGGTFFANGTPMSIWGDQYRGYHVGTSDQTPDVTFGPDRTATVAGPNAATDGSTGAVAIGWDDLDVGRTQVAFVQPTTSPWFPPGPTMSAPGSAGSGGNDRLEMTGRSDAAAGIFVAYLQSNDRPAVWRIGASSPMVLTKRDAVYPGVAMSVDGRLWAFWHQGHTTGQTRRVFASRSNEKATRFGETVVVKPPRGTNDGNVWSLEGEGTAAGGALDLVALITRNPQGDDVGNYVTRILPGITLRVKRLDGAVRFTTFDAGETLATKVRFDGEVRKTGPDGKLVIKAAPGRYRARATHDGYTPITKRVKIDNPDI